MRTINVDRQLVVRLSCRLLVVVVEYTKQTTPVSWRQLLSSSSRTTRIVCSLLLRFGTHTQPHGRPAPIDEWNCQQTTLDYSILEACWVIFIRLLVLLFALVSPSIRRKDQLLFFPVDFRCFSWWPWPKNCQSVLESTFPFLLLIPEGRCPGDIRDQPGLIELDL
jgi:hypothetical protein